MRHLLLGEIVMAYDDPLAILICRSALQTAVVRLRVDGTGLISQLPQVLGEVLGGSIGSLAVIYDKSELF